jgi:hypothetical protein
MHDKMEPGHGNWLREVVMSQHVNGTAVGWTRVREPAEPIQSCRCQASQGGTRCPGAVQGNPQELIVGEWPGVSDHDALARPLPSTRLYLPVEFTRGEVAKDRCSVEHAARIRKGFAELRFPDN